MRRLFLALCLAVFAILFAVRPAAATTITVASQTIPNWHLTTTVGTGVVDLRIYADRSFITSAGQPIQPGSPQGGAVYKIVKCNVGGPDADGNYTLTIPLFTIDSTTDAQDNPGKNAHYTGYFFVGSRQLAIYGGFESFRVLPLYSTNPTTWALIRADNTAATPIPQDTRSYTDQQINRLISDAVSMSSGVTTIEGQTGPTISFVDDTNISVVGSANNLTLTWLSQLAVPRGGTGSSTAAGARTNLGAAASGANSDITSLAGLTTALSSQQGGTGFGSSNHYTVGSLLYADSTTTLTQVTPGTAGFVLQSQGAGLAPIWAAASGTIGGGGANTRVAFWSGATTLTSDASYLFDSATGRLSVGTADSTNSLNLPNAGYVSGRGSVAGAQVKIASIADQTKYTGVATSATIDAITLGSSVPVAHVYTDGGASALNPLAPDYQVRAAGIRVGFGTAGAYNDSASSNIFHFSAQASNIGSGNTVAIFSEGLALGANANVWAINPVAYTNVGGTTTASAIMCEGNFGALGVSPNQSAYGMVLAANSDPAAPAGTNKSFLQMQANGSYSSVVNGIVFSDGTGQAVTNAQINAQGTTATYAGLFTLSAYATGFDFAQSTFSSSSQIRLANGGATSSGIRVQNNANSANFNIARMTTADYIEFGDGTTGLGGMRFLVSASSAETLRFLPGATGLPGNAGWNQSTPTAQQHVTAINKRTISGTVNFSTATPTIVQTNASTNFLADLAPGNSVELSWYPGHLYTVLSVDPANTFFTLTSSAVAAGNFTGGTVNSDYRTLLIEGANGEDWLSFDNQHTLKLYGDSAFGDLRGMLSLTSRVTPAKRLTLGVNDTSSYGYISSFQEGVGWKPLFLQAGAAGTAVGGVVIGTASPSSLGAMLKVEGAQTDPGANNTGSEFNNLSTSTGYFQKISASYQGIGSWVGPNIGVFTITTGGVDASAEDLTNVPLAAFGGKNYFGPYSTQITSPAPPANLFTAIVDVYGIPTDSITRGTDTATTHATDTIDGSGTTWDTVGAADRIRSGDSVQVGSDTRVYQALAVNTDNVHLQLTEAYGGTPAGSVEMRRDPYLARLRNSYGTERFRVESSGFTKVTGIFVQNQESISSAATLLLGNGNAFKVSGNTTITNIAFDNFGLSADSSQAGRMICIIWDTGATFDITDGGNIKLSANITTADEDDVLWLYTDGTNFYQMAPVSNN